MWISIASTVGYALSKIPAYSIVSTMAREKRKRWLIILLLAMLIPSLGFYAVLPPYIKVRADVCVLLFSQPAYPDILSLCLTTLCLTTLCLAAHWCLYWCSPCVMGVW